MNRQRSDLSCRTAEAFTLVEVLVVISIIAILTLLLLPAVQSAKESSHRAACGATQTKLALAMARFDLTKGHLPGWRNSLEIQNPPLMSEVSWFVLLLPYAEETDVYEAVVARKAYSVGGSSNGNSGSGHEVPWSQCPSNKAYDNAHKTNYVASGGLQYTNRNDGALWDNVNGQAMSMAQIASGNGLATTLMISEKQPGTFSMNWSPGSVDNKGNPMVAIRNLDLSFGFPNGSNTVVTAIGANTKLVNGSALASAHPGGVVAAFADSHVRFLKDALAPHVYAHLVTSLAVFDPGVEPTPLVKEGPFPYSFNSLTANRYLLSPSWDLSANGLYSLKEDDY